MFWWRKRDTAKIAGLSPSRQVLYNSNDRETKRLNKQQLKEVENGKNLEEIKENSSERKKFKRVALGGVCASLIELLIEF